MPSLRRVPIPAVALGCLVLGLLAPPVAATGGERTRIGSSVEGRPIVLLREDAVEPALRVLVVGCIHGNETAGMRVARQLIRGPLPRRVELAVVPTINPDGVAADTRGNAHGVDLNRNFPYAWAHLGGGEYSGTGPLSEPESRAVARAIRRLRPDLTIWFHQPFGLVDRSGGSPFPERRYSQLVGLPLVQLTRYHGSATSWENHTFPGTTSFVVELPHSVGGALVSRAAVAVRTLAAELASPELAASKPVGPE